MSYQPRNEMFAKVILASEHPNGTPLYSVHMRYPRPIHGEVMTHREFSRNARSSRAVPVKTMLEEVRTKPYIPWHWGANQKGMQAVEECDAEIHNWMEAFEPQPKSKQFLSREDAWLEAADMAIRAAEAFMNAGYHKQIVNRLLEPFSWIDTLVTTTSFSNFLWLREHKDAEPHLQDLAHMVAEAIQGAELQELPPGYWHLPYIRPEEYRDSPGENFEEQVEFLKKISAARCARISYTPFDGDPSYERELERYNMLVTSERVHASPLEHQATPDEIKTDPYADWLWKNPGLHGNLPGWIQNRKLVPGEYHA